MSRRVIIVATGRTGPSKSATNITVTPTGGISSTNVQAALAELDSEKQTAAQVLAALSPYATAITDHIADTSDAHAASAITNTPAGSIAATTVQAAIDELDSEKLPKVNPTVTIDGNNKALDLRATAAKATLRFYRPEDAITQQYPEWRTATLFNEHGALHTNAWMVISGHMPATPDAEGNYYPLLAGGQSKQSMLSIWSDVNSCALEVRPASNTSTDRCIDILDTSANVRLAVEYTGQLSWGATTYAATDTTLSRVSAGRLRVGSANGTVTTNFDINSGSGGSAMFRLLINGTESLWIGSGGAANSYIVQGGATVARLYNSGRLTVGGPDISPAVFTVGVGGTGSVPTAQLRRANASSTYNTLELTDESGTVFHRFTHNGYSVTKKNSAIAGADLAIGEASYYFDSTAGAARIVFYGKNASGTVVAGSVSLT